MPINPEPRPVELDAPGLYETRVVEAFQELTVSQDARLIRLHLRLEGGAELLVPLPLSEIEKLRAALGEYPDYPDIPQFR